MEFCLWEIILISLIEVRRLCMCGCHHFLTNVLDYIDVKNKLSRDSHSQLSLLACGCDVTIGLSTCCSHRPEMIVNAYFIVILSFVIFLRVILSQQNEQNKDGFSLLLLKLSQKVI